MGKFVKGDVVVAPSPFSDLSAAKKRPALVPDLGKVREFAAKLHAEGKPWKGEVFGWQVEYNPERPDPPLDSKMTFTPADFCIGESGFGSFLSCGNTVRTKNQ